MSVPYSLGEFTEGLQILSRYLAGGYDHRFCLGADHDIIYVYVPVERVLVEDAAKLEALNFHKHDGGNWAYNL